MKVCHGILLREEMVIETVAFSKDKWYVVYIIPEQNKQVKNHRIIEGFRLEGILEIT